MAMIQRTCGLHHQLKINCFVLHTYILCLKRSHVITNSLVMLNDIVCISVLPPAHPVHLHSSSHFCSSQTMTFWSLVECLDELVNGVVAPLVLWIIGIFLITYLTMIDSWVVHYIVSKYIQKNVNTWFPSLFANNNFILPYKKSYPFFKWFIIRWHANGSSQRNHGHRNCWQSKSKWKVVSIFSFYVAEVWSDINTFPVHETETPFGTWIIRTKS